MATRKELVEAFSFGRRRLVTAFLSGAPGAREAEPARPGRSIVGGAVLAVLVAAGVAIAGVLAPAAPDNWMRRGLVVSKDTGAAYVVVGDDPELRPVVNATSARLILDGDAEPTLVEQEAIDEQRIGDDLGIVDAPASLPAPDRLVDSGWTACTAAGAGIRLRIAERPDLLPAGARGVTVSNGGELFVVVPSDELSGGGAVLLPMGAPGDQTDNLLAALGLQTTAAAIPVDRAWIDLFPVGAPLDWRSFGLTGYGSTPEYAAGAIGAHEIGDLLMTGEERLLLTESGPVALTEFAATVYRNVVAPDDRVVAPEVVDTAPRVPRGDAVLEGAGWPATVPDAAVDEPCAELVAEAGAVPAVRLGSPGASAGAADVLAGERDVDVVPGRGAHVLSGGWTDPDRGAPYLVDAQGRANRLVGDDAAAALGYGDHRAVVVPETWLRLLGCGVTLSREAALSPPEDEAGSSVSGGCGDRPEADDAATWRR
ncbi:type VII secretion protein EccB [Nocardioides soli]|uniref:type VII secretion protein EccB n=1 Tax=Nocardioides soli TaxID=1036020 RepID=UPI00160FEC75|nr:type VII secretion protein EccB [Nocardioides soli]